MEEQAEVAAGEYPCKKCDKMFPNEADLELHDTNCALISDLWKRKNEGSPRWKCVECDIQYKSHSSYYFHCRIKHDPRYIKPKKTFIVTATSIDHLQKES